MKSTSKWIILALMASFFVSCSDDSEEAGESGYKLKLLSQIGYREMVNVPGGTWDPTPLSDFDISNTISSYSIGKYEITYELWYNVLKWGENNGYQFQNVGLVFTEGDDNPFPTSSEIPTTNILNKPVQGIAWRDALVWCNAYSEMAGFQPVYYTANAQVLRDSRNSNGTVVDAAIADWTKNGYRLPSETEWEYAASYISAGNFTWGGTVSGDLTPYGTESTIYGNYMWYMDNTQYIRDVGGKLPNSLGIYDMAGNAYEWVWDPYNTYPNTPQVNYRGTVNNELPKQRVLRGGCYSCIPFTAFTYTRLSATIPETDSNWLTNGLRVARYN